MNVKWALFFSLIFLPTTISAQEAAEPPRSLWVWDAKVYMSQAAARQLFEFCKSKGINRLYLSVLSFNEQNTQNYRIFNKLAHNQGIFVHALGGDPRWGLERYHQQPLRWAEDILAFNRSVRPRERFDGIENDTEVYLLGSRWEQNKEQILKEYLDLNRKIMDLIKIEESQISYGCDIPFWYDDDPSMAVNWNGQVKPPSLHVLDTVSTVTVMDYRNFAEGPNGSIALAKNEIEYADSAKKRVFIGQETTENLYPEYITFAGMSETEMESQIKKLVEAYINSPSFGGIAIHHYTSYKKLVEKR